MAQNDQDQELPLSCRLRLNHHEVPCEKKSLTFIDPQGLVNLEGEELTVSLVKFMAMGSLCWLSSALKVSQKWWRNNHHRVPLLKVLEGIRAQKPSRGAAKRLPRKQHVLVAIN